MTRREADSKPRVLFIANPLSLHDESWMVASTREFYPFLIARRSQREAELGLWADERDITFLGFLDDFSIRSPFRTLRQVWRIRAWVRQYNIALIHVLYAEPNALWGNFKALIGVPFIITTRGTDILKAIPRFSLRKDPLARLLKWLYKLAFTNASAITCTSNRQRESLTALCPPAEKITHIIRTGVDIEQFETTYGEHLPPELKDLKFVFFPRNMAPIYQHEFSIAAIEKLPPETRDGYAFVFLGRDGSQRDYIQRVLGLLESCPARTICLEFLTAQQLKAALRAAQLVVMTPFSDGAPVTAAEAMLCETPTILPPLPYDDELFSRGCYFFEEWEPQCLADLMSRVLTSDSNAKIVAGVEDIKRSFCRKSEMRRLHRIYHRVVREEQIGRSRPAQG